ITDNGIHLNSRGYSLLAEAIEKNLGWKPIRLNEKKTETIRQIIAEKNKLFFNRWRPQNETYLFGFRKYEQGQNAKEIPMFDPLVSEQEEKIFKLVELKTRKYELAPSKPGDQDALKKPEAAEKAPA